MRFTIYLEARHHPIGPPTDPKLGQENGAACCLSLPALPSEAIIQRYTLLHLNHSRLVRFSVCPSHLRSLAHALRIARTLLRVLTAALRTALVLLRLVSRPRGFRVPPQQSSAQNAEDSSGPPENARACLGRRAPCIASRGVSRSTSEARD
jgi:hypothetical protein